MAGHNPVVEYQLRIEPDPPQTAEQAVRDMDRLFRKLLDHPETITIHVRPKSKARPRVGKWGAYMPEEYKLWCKRFAEMMDAAGGMELLGGPDNALILVMEYGIKVGKARSKKWRELNIGELAKIGRADVDNLEGAVMDSLLPKEEGGDARVCWVWHRKVWAEDWYVKVRPIFRAGS